MAVLANLVMENGRGIWPDCQLSDFNERISMRKEQREQSCVRPGTGANQTVQRSQRMRRAELLLLVIAAFVLTAPSLHNISNMQLLAAIF
jgi:hypothetical protein